MPKVILYTARLPYKIKTIKTCLSKLYQSSCRAVVMLREQGRIAGGHFLRASFMRHLLYCERHGRKIGCFPGLDGRSFYQDRIRRCKQS
jgi:hypothetical protein